MAKKLVRMAIAYDFDGTLAPGNMQEYDFIPKLHMNSDDFWGEVKETAKEHDADQILAYMYVMLEKARREKIAVRKSDFKNYGKGIELFDGVKEWFARIKAYGKQRGLEQRNGRAHLHGVRSLEYLGSRIYRRPCLQGIGGGKERAEGG